MPVTCDATPLCLALAVSVALSVSVSVCLCLYTHTAAKNDYIVRYTETTETILFVHRTSLQEGIASSLCQCDRDTFGAITAHG